MEIEISEKFENLFNLLDSDFHPEVDTVIMTGGRYSLKSYTASIFALCGLVQNGWSTLYTRFTNLSITDSVKPEVSDKISLLGFDELVEDSKTQIDCGDNRISFKGIKTSSKTQTANLKSLSGYNVFINDEAEELPDYKTYQKIYFSIRSTTKRNISILILNPTSKLHWIYKEFFEKRGLVGGENTIKGNVLYIHTSYLDCDFNRMPKNILSEYEKLKIDNPDEYYNVVLGGWLSGDENSPVKKDWFYISNNVNSDARKTIFIDGAYTNDKKNDPTGILITSFQNSKVVIHNYIRVWLSIAELLNEFPKIMTQNNITNYDEILIEPKASGKDIVSLFRSVFDIPTSEYVGKFVSVSKMERIQTTAPYINNSKFILEQGNWNDGFISEICMFPNAKHDEAVDLISYACEHYLIQRGMFMINV